MNPRTQECFGQYGYGTGYFFGEAHRAARGKGEHPGFCDTCPKRNDCWQEHRASVNRAFPVETAAFVAAMDQAKAAGDDQAGGRLAVRMAEAGNPDPWLAGMFANVQRGAQDRLA